MRPHGPALPVLTFHTLEDGPSAISFAPAAFRRGMARLYEGGYRTMSLLEAADCLRRRVPFPRRTVVLTFDDGYATVYGEAFPTLQRYGMSATVFLTVGEPGQSETGGRLPPLGGRSMLSWPEIREMQRWAIDFGAHTLTHPDLTRLPRERIEAELRDSKAMIEDALSTPVTCFAYPGGRYDRRSREAARRHFACACSDELGLLTVGSDLYALARVEMYYFRTGRSFDLLLTGLLPWYLGARVIPRRIRRVVQRGLRRWTDRSASA